MIKTTDEIAMEKYADWEVPDSIDINGVTYIPFNATDTEAAARWLGAEAMCLGGELPEFEVMLNRIEEIEMGRVDELMAEANLRDEEELLNELRERGRKRG